MRLTLQALRRLRDPENNVYRAYGILIVSGAIGFRIGALDTLPYALESGPAMQRILLDVYGADLFLPPEGARGTGVLPRAPHRALWNATRVSGGKEIGRTYDVTLVVTPADWTLDLPVAADNGAFRLYRIPR